MTKEELIETLANKLPMDRVEAEKAINIVLEEFPEPCCGPCERCTCRHVFRSHSPPGGLGRLRIVSQRFLFATECGKGILGAYKSAHGQEGGSSSGIDSVTVVETILRR